MGRERGGECEDEKGGGSQDEKWKWTGEGEGRKRRGEIGGGVKREGGEERRGGGVEECIYNPRAFLRDVSCCLDEGLSDSQGNTAAQGTVICRPSFRR